jgi:hypothetical protein
VYTGGGFSEKGVSVQVSEKATLTPDTCNMEPETIIKYLSHGLLVSCIGIFYLDSNHQ